LPTSTKASSIQLLLANAILISLVVLVREDQLARLDYWRSMGFTPDTIYSILSLRFPAVKGNLSIPGLPTMDWVQVFLVVIILMDVYYFASVLSGRSDRKQKGNHITSSMPSA
jgi:hypothetical protein